MLRRILFQIQIKIKLKDTRQNKNTLFLLVFMQISLNGCCFLKNNSKYFYVALSSWRSTTLFKFIIFNENVFEDDLLFTKQRLNSKLKTCCVCIRFKLCVFMLTCFFKVSIPFCNTPIWLKYGFRCDMAYINMKE